MEQVRQRKKLWPIRRVGWGGDRNKQNRPRSGKPGAKKITAAGLDCIARRSKPASAPATVWSKFNTETNSGRLESTLQDLEKMGKAGHCCSTERYSIRRPGCHRLEKTSFNIDDGEKFLKAWQLQKSNVAKSTFHDINYRINRHTVNRKIDIIFPTFLW